MAILKVTQLLSLWLRDRLDAAGVTDRWHWSSTTVNEGYASRAPRWPKQYRTVHYPIFWQAHGRGTFNSGPKDSGTSPWSCTPTTRTN